LRPTRLKPNRPAGSTIFVNIGCTAKRSAALTKIEAAKTATVNPLEANNLCFLFFVFLFAIFSKFEKLASRSQTLDDRINDV